MKKVLLSLSLIFGFAGYAVYRNDSRLFIKNSEMASAQNADLTTPINANALPKVTTVMTGTQKDAPKPPSSIKTDDENNNDWENVGEDDDEEGEGGKKTVKVQAVSSKISPSQTKTPEKSSARSMPMMNMSGNMMMDKGQYKNGEFTGNIADAYYGSVQVKAVISGGKITDVQFLDYPHDRQNSIRINTYAMPILASEAIKTQSAEVDAVSGASATSGAFKESLASALAKTKI